MKYFLSASILILASASIKVSAVPAVYNSSYANNYPVNPRPASVSFPCGDSADNWVIDVGFGTPPQDAKLLVDSTFESNFVAGVMCHSDFCENQSSSLYNAGQSSTSALISRRETFYLSENRVVKGDLYEDTITLNGTKYPNEQFGKAFSVEGFPSNANYAGVFGLHPPIEIESSSSKSYNDSSSHYKRMAGGIDKNKGDSSVLKEVPGEDETPPPLPKRRNTNSEVCTLILGIDYDRISSPIAWLDLPTCEYGKSPFWKTDLECVKIKGVVDLKFTNTIAEFDTTVKYIHAPHSDVAKIHQGLKAKYNNHVKTYVFECCEAKNLEISFTKYKVTLPAESWTYPIDNQGDYCASRILVSNATDIPVSRWRLGTAFMENFYTIFSVKNEKVGLAFIDGQDTSLITSK